MLALLISTFIYAQTGLKIEGEMHLQTNVMRWSNKKGGIRCGRGGHRVDYHHNINGKETVDQLLSDPYAMRITTQDGANISNRTYLEIYLDTYTEAFDDRTTISLSGAMNEKTEGSDFWKRKCRHLHMSQKVQSGGFDGVISFQYEIPQGVWLVKVNRDELRGMLAASEAQFANFLLNWSDDNGYIWVKPGTNLRYEVDVNLERNENIDFSEASRITFYPIGDRFSSTDKIPEVLRELKVGLNVLLNGGEEGFDSFLKNGSTILMNKDLLKRYLEKVSMDDLNHIIQLSKELAFATPESLSSEIQMHVKAMATLLSYELASAYVEINRNFCEIKEISLPYTDQKLRVSGLDFVAHKMRLALQTMNTDITSLYRDLLSVLIDLSDKKMTYGDVVKDEDLRNRINSAYEVVRKVASPKIRPYAVILQDFKDIHSAYQSIGSDEVSTRQILLDLKELSDLEYNFVKELHNKAQEFNGQNNEVINVNVLIKMVDTLEAKTPVLAMKMRDNLRFMATDSAMAESYSSGDIAATMLSHKSNSINVLNNLSVSDFEGLQDQDVDLRFYKLGEAYVDRQRIEQNISTVNACVESSVGAK